MKILIAGPYNSGGSRLLECIRMVCKICNIPIEYGSYVAFNTKKANEHEGVYIIKCNELHEMFFNVRFFDFVFVPVRDVRYFCKTDVEAIKNIALFQCWKTQATQIVRYEQFGIESLVNIFKSMNIMLEHEVIDYIDHFISNRYSNKNIKKELSDFDIQKNKNVQDFIYDNNYS
jgi:hypothetical protein